MPRLRDLARLRLKTRHVLPSGECRDGPGRCSAPRHEAAFIDRAGRWWPLFCLAPLASLTFVRCLSLPPLPSQAELMIDAPWCTSRFHLRLRSSSRAAAVMARLAMRKASSSRSMPAWTRSAATVARRTSSSATSRCRLERLAHPFAGLRSKRDTRSPAGSAPLRFRRVVKGAEHLHAELDIGDARRLHAFHRGPGHPFGVHPTVLAIGHVGAGGHVVANRVLRRVPVVQVGEALVPVVAVEAAWVVSRDEGLGLRQRLIST